MEYSDIKTRLQALADLKYKEFHATLLPGTTNLIGVRIPDIRNLAKQMLKETWRPFVEQEHSEYVEEVMLQAIIIGRAAMPAEERERYIRLFVPRINNWSVCDIFCGELKRFATKNPDIARELIRPYLNSDKEFEKRFGIVMLFHYIDEAHLSDILNYADDFAHPGYYARMAMAWLLSACFVKFPNPTMAYLKRSRLDTWTFNKTLQKITESLRVDAETKQVIRSMKRQ